MTTIPKWVLNTEIGNITREEIYRQFLGFRDRDGYEGVMIVPWGKPDYLNDVFFEKYGMALDVARELGMKIIIWDENCFPSGHAGKRLAMEYPEFVARRLDMREVRLARGEAFAVANASVFMGAVVERSGKWKVESGKLETPAEGGKNALSTFNSQLSTCYVEIAEGFTPDAETTVLVFECVPSVGSNVLKPNGAKAEFHDVKLVDYLDGDAVRAFLGLTHELYYSRFKEFFGSTIVAAFYDEPAFWHVEGGRIWTRKFNEKFRAAHGFSPVPLYPALWRDIGPQTALARNLLFGFRAKLYSGEYVKTLADWCEVHGVVLTGHMDQEENVNPVSNCGDLMECFRHQQIPGCDEIGWYARGSKAWKLVSSAAENFGKPVVMCEVFGGMEESLPAEALKKEALDLLAKGVNFFVPHGTWYDNDPAEIIFPPELSYRSEKFAAPLREFNDYVREMGTLFQSCQPVHELAMLYPIEDLQAHYDFTQGDGGVGTKSGAYRGGTPPAYSDYLDLGEWLMYDFLQDFVHLHPSVLSTRDLGGFRAIIVPGMDVIGIETLRALRRYKDAGGTVFGTHVPTRPVEPDTIDERDPHLSGEFQRLANGLFSPMEDLGKIPFSIRLECSTPRQGGQLAYTRRRNADRDFLFIANSSDDPLPLVLTTPSGRVDMRIEKNSSVLHDLSQ